MSWQPEVDELRRCEALADLMGGEEKVKRQRGKLHVRERISRLLDEDSFREVGKIAGRAAYDSTGEMQRYTPANCIVGRGRIDGRVVVVGADDFTVRGGAADAAIIGKQILAEQMANELQLLLVWLIDGTGGGGSVKTLDNTDARTYISANPGWDYVTANMYTVPVGSLLLGPVAGLGAARAVSPLLGDGEGLSQLFVAGPPVVRHVGEDLDKEQLGGSAIHTRNGAIDDEVASEDEAFSRMRQWLSYLPSSVQQLPPHAVSDDSTDRTEDWLLEAIPRDRRKVYRVRDILDAVLDRDSFFEMGQFHGRSAVTGLARLAGWPVTVLANDSYYFACGWSAGASMKVTCFVEFAKTFHLPVVHFVDNPGFVIGLEAERAATIRHGARALAIVYQASVPWCCIILRKAFGVVAAAHCNASCLRYRYAWPSGDWGSLLVEGGIEAAYTAELREADVPDALLERIYRRLEVVRSPFRSAEAFLIEDLIDPRETRPLLCEFANLAAPLRQSGMTALGIRP